QASTMRLPSQGPRDDGGVRLTVFGIRMDPSRGSDVIEVHDRYYILATSDRVDDRTRVLKNGETFAVLDRRGEAHALGRGELGLFVRGTRMLSRLELEIDGHRPLLLASTLRCDAALLTVDLTNPDVRRGEQLVLENGWLHVERTLELLDGGLDEQIVVTSYAQVPAEARIDLIADADFADIFEVRGFERRRAGERLPVPPEPDALVFAYRGLDGVERRTRVWCEPAARRSDDRLFVDLQLAPRES